MECIGKSGSIKTFVSNDQYCTVKWSESSAFQVIPQSDFECPPSLIKLFMKHSIIIGEERKEATVLCKGNKDECDEMLRSIQGDSNESGTNEQNYLRKPENNIGKSLSQSENEKVPNRQVHDEKVIETLFKLLQATILELKTDGNNQVHRVSCDGCNRFPIYGNRYKCLECTNLDLCARCFEHRVEPQQHKSGHLVAHLRLHKELFGREVRSADLTLEKLKEFYAKESHESIVCDGCEDEDFSGLRFKCDACPDYDLCQTCAENRVVTKQHQSTHPLILASRKAILQISPDDIELKDKLGSGAFGKITRSSKSKHLKPLCIIGSVYKAHWKSKNMTVACKIIEISNPEHLHLYKSFIKELQAYMELSGGHILKTYGFAKCKNDDKDTFMLISEFMSRGSLATLLKAEEKLSLRRKVQMAKQIASGMRRIHDHDMIHRDIRPDNILVDEHYTCKIGDMGIARRVDPTNQHTQIGCQPFMPPEFHEGQYDQRLDIFTFGLTLNQLFTETAHSFRYLFKEKIVFREQSPIFRDLINRCTAKNCNQRPSAAEIEATLEFYETAFNEMVLKNNIRYIRLSTEDKNKVFLKFYEKISEKADEFIRKKFPRELCEEEEVQGVRVIAPGEKESMQFQCPVQ